LTTHPLIVSAPGEILAADARCQGLIQSSATLAYACLLIRRGDLPLARHSLDALEQRPRAAYREIIPYIRAWIEMDAGNFGGAKAGLTAALQKQSGDMVALSLLQACIVLELRQDVESPAEPQLPAEIEPSAVLPSVSGEAAFPDAEMASYQGVIADPQTKAFGLWDGAGRSRLAGPGLDQAPLFEVIRQELPASLSAGVANLDGGEIQKICFSFDSMTVASWHAPEIHAGLVAGPLQSALLTLVRAENAFGKRPAQPGFAGGSG
jgi:hypothetical protein